MATAEHSIIIDTDPGQDDALAILLALASPQIELLGITAVAGNVPLALTSVNVRKILELANRTDIKVFEGSSRPLMHPLTTAEHVHGSTGLDGPDLPEPQMPVEEQFGPDFIIDTILSRKEKTVTLCALGPLTNIGLALIKAPQITPLIKQIILMGGGCFEGGNITPAAEFNIFVDPEAASLVFQSGVPTTVLPLDCTHKALTTTKRLDAFRALKTAVGDAVVELLDFFERFDEEKYGTDGGPLHDPCVIAYLTNPELFNGRDVNIEVETGSSLTRGMTVVDWWGVTDRKKNATFIRDIDADGFFELLTTRIGQL